MQYFVYHQREQWLKRGSGCCGRSRGQRFLAVATVAMVLAANRGNGGGQATVTEAEAAREQTTINQKAVAIAAVTVLVTAEMVAAAMAAVMVLAPTGAEVAVNMGWR